MLNFSRGDFEAMTAFLQDLVRTRSPSSQEREVAVRIEKELRHVGVADVWVDRIGNVVGRIGRGKGKKLLLDGHMDTVEVSDWDDWQHDPFGGEIEEGVLYGRGAVDMKGALAAMVYAAKLLLDAEVELKGDLYVVGVVQEEPYEGLGMRVLVEEEGLRPDWVILGEPSGLRVRRGHPGRLELRVTVRGVASHASAPQRGENAIYGAARIVAGLEMLAGHLAAGQRGSLAVTEIESTAGSRNAVPDRCSMIIDRRLAPGEEEAQAVAEVRQVVERASLSSEVEVTAYESLSYTGYRAYQRSYFPPWELDEEHPLVRSMAGAAHTVLGKAPEIGLWSFSTDGTYTMGVAGIPTVGFGPGEAYYAHRADERIRLEDMAAAARVYAQLAVDLLGQG